MTGRLFVTRRYLIKLLYIQCMWICDQMCQTSGFLQLRKLTVSVNVMIVLLQLWPFWFWKLIINEFDKMMPWGQQRFVWVFKFSIASIFCTHDTITMLLELLIYIFMWQLYVYLLPKPIKSSKKTGNVIMFTLKNWLCYFLFLLFSLYQVLTSVYPDILTVVNISVQKL